MGVVLSHHEVDKDNLGVGSLVKKLEDQRKNFRKRIKKIKYDA